MLVIGVGCHEKGMAAFRPAHGRFVADTVGLLWGNLVGGKGLPYLLTEDVGIRLHSGGAVLFGGFILLCHLINTSFLLLGMKKGPNLSIKPFG